ncbi:OLC1v1022771C1 [Oldenlandia corymbosa var. corymbosa]|uniref:OLC1v1022771C1 n=1 Tax=Oldenlandia corymbosa var. corymbosa TaxID=529605 RepID=A0AAV1BYK0_OLDCO|nr:OLC1v1022771C1 [Oldenlandia corymbosa var. corymbosa]
MSVMEEREEEMISPTGAGGSNRGPTFRLAHFLAPTLTSDDGGLLEVPSTTLSSDNLNLNQSKNESLKVKFTGWRFPLENWNDWTQGMHSKYHSVWKKAGICEAIMNSTYRIPRNDELIYGFVEKWCPDTNTFLFPWGEATITLEDMMVLGGFSVLGDPVFSSTEGSESEGVEKKLISARLELGQSKARKARQNHWMQKHMNTGSEIEHEAFLALWLSRFVFPSKTLDGTIERNVLSIAVHLARGTKIALAPAVLASIYSSLSEMKKAHSSSESLLLPISAPLQLVQIWAWERFSSLRPEPLPFENDQPMFAKWHNLSMKNTGDIKLALDKAADIFLWRPYAVGWKSIFPHGIFKEEARWIRVGSSVKEEQEMLVRWLRVSELVGIDSNCIEQYLPHRVAMQFGFDQDIPGSVARANASHYMAWENYNRKIRDKRLYVPSRLFESAVSTRYLEWWKNGRSLSIGVPVNCKSKGSKKERLLSSLLEVLPKKRKKISKSEILSNKRPKISKCVKSSSGENLKDDYVVSSGFSPMANHDEMTLGSVLEKLAHKRKKGSELEKSSNKSQKVSKHFESSSEKNLKADAVFCSSISPESNNAEMPLSSFLEKLRNRRSKISKLEESPKRKQKVSKRLKSSFEKNSKDDALVHSGFSPKSNDDEMLLSCALEKLCNQRKKISKVEKSSNTISKDFESSSEKNLKDDAIVSVDFSPKYNHGGIPHSQDTEEQHQPEPPRDASGSKDKALNAIKTTGTDSKEAFANEKRSNSMEKVVESEDESSKSRNLEEGRAEEIVGSAVYLSTSENNLNDDDAVVRSVSHNPEEMPHPEGIDAPGMKDEGLDMIKLAGPEPEKVSFDDQMMPNSKPKTEESEKGSSKTGSDEDNQETEADCNKDLNLNTINGRECSLDAIEEISIQWDTRLKNLEKIVADLKIKYASAKK